MADCLTLDLRVTAGSDGRHEVTAEEPGSGRAGPERLGLHELDAPGFRAALEIVRRGPPAADGEPFRVVGDGLFRALFGGDVLSLFAGLHDQRIRPNPHAALRLRLDIDERLPDLAALPWELLRWRDAPLSTQVQTLLSRRVAGLGYGTVRPLSVADRPRVLLVIPRGSGLATEGERAILTAALARNGIPYDVLEDKVTLGLLADVLAGGAYHILHFIGHGAEAMTGDGGLSGYLRFNAPGAAGESADEEWVEHDRIQAVLSTHTDLRLVVLNACSSAAIGGRPPGAASRGFSGLVPAILRAGVPAALAMQHPIRDDVAIQFADTFYSRLTGGRWAGQVEIATALARNACYLSFPNDRGFATPVLFLRGEGRLFELAPQEKETPAMDAVTLAPEITALLIQHLTQQGPARDRSRGAALHVALQTAAQSRPAWAEALADLAAAPADEDAQAAARIQLKKLLARDEGLASELERLLRADEAVLPGPQAGVQITAGDRSIVAGRKVNITGTVITGDIGGNVTIGKGG